MTNRNRFKTPVAKSRLTKKRHGMMNVLHMRLKLKDFGYILISTLILTGLLKAAEGSIVQTLSDPPQVPQAQASTALIPSPSPTSDTTPVYVLNDDRSDRLQAFLEEQHSPLAPEASYIVAQSDANGIDWTLMVAISHMESSYGKDTNQSSHNPFGLGGSHFMYFQSWKQAIKYEAELLGKNYRQDQVRAIKERYCPSSDNCNPAWASTVVTTSQAILEKGATAQHDHN